jgi:hypothetical protein
LRSQRTFASKDHHFVVCNLVSQAHVTRDPVTLVSLYLLPNVFRNTVALDSVNNLVLVNSASKRKNVIVFEGTESDT